MMFADLGLSPELLQAISQLGFEMPTPVQEEVIPVLLAGDRDVVALAQTGTGKTAAFGLPLLQLLELDSSVPQALVLCPTRELCMQITRDLQSFAASLPAVRVLAVYGGADIKPQLAALERGVQVVVATPGRMLDVLRRKRVDFSKVARVVLDEADEMLNMGFEEDIEAILSTVPESAQTLLFSATMPREVATISRKYMSSPVEVTVGTRNSGAENVSHEYYVIQAKDRYAALRRIVDIYPRMYGIVFCRTRIETQQVADRLTVDGYNAQALHGDLSQMQRDSVMKKFRNRHVQILVATDVAARGLDVEDLSHVINYNLPDELNAYTHRSGRTGRAGKEGVSVAIIHLREQSKIRQLERVVGKQFTRRPVPTGEEISRSRLVSLVERVRDYASEHGLIDRHLDELCALLEGVSREELVKRFVSVEMHRMLHFYRAAPDLNAGVPTREHRRGRERDEGPQGRGERPQKRPERQARPQRSPVQGRPERPERGAGRDPRKKQDMAGLVMNVGNLNGLTPPLLLNLVNAANRKARFTIGKINIVDKQAYFEVPRDEVQSVMDSFAQGDLNLEGREVSVATVGTALIDQPRKKSRGQGGPKKRR